MTTTAIEKPAASIALPGPGIYENVSFEDYCQWPALNNSTLSRFQTAPAMVQLEDDETKSKARGTICHAGIWEPGRFEEEYAIGPDVNLSTNVGKAEWAAFKDANPGVYHVRGKDGAAMLGVREAIWSHEGARQLLGDKGPAELCIVWDDPDTGLRCKARIDKLATTLSYAIDLKTTRDASRDGFKRAIRTYRYHQQAAFYLHGLAAVGIVVEGFAFMAWETEPAYLGTIHDVQHDAIELAWEELRIAMADYAYCKSSGIWPRTSADYPSDPVRVFRRHVERIDWDARKNPEEY